MYYYQIQDVNGVVIKESVVPYDTGNDAVNAAKDDLAAMPPTNYPVEIRISDKPFCEEPRYFSSTYYMDAEMVRQHALKRIEEANRKELIDIILHAQEMHEAMEDRYMRGLMTSSDYAKAEYGIWVNATADIERIEARG